MTAPVQLVALKPPIGRKTWRKQKRYKRLYSFHCTPRDPKVMRQQWREKGYPENYCPICNMEKGECQTEGGKPEA
jgi:hypothetical protein